MIGETDTCWGRYTIAWQSLRPARPFQSADQAACVWRGRRIPTSIKIMGARRIVKYELLVLSVADLQEFCYLAIKAGT